MSAHLSSVKTGPPPTTDRHHRRVRWLVAAILAVSMFVTTAYTVTSYPTGPKGSTPLPYHACRLSSVIPRCQLSQPGRSPAVERLVSSWHAS